MQRRGYRITVANEYGREWCRTFRRHSFIGRIVHRDVCVRLGHGFDERRCHRHAAADTHADHCTHGDTYRCTHGDTYRCTHGNTYRCAHGNTDRRAHGCAYDCANIYSDSSTDTGRGNAINVDREYR